MGLRLVVAGAAMFFAAATTAQADVNKPLGLTCAAQDGGGRLCSGLVKTSFDGVPLDVNVALPPASRGSGPFPLVVIAHGYGGAKEGYGTTAQGAQLPGVRTFAESGYAVLSATARGFNGSCGTPAARLAGGADCLNGFIRLDDYRFEARDIQDLAGRLADDGVAQPQQVGVTGPSYGGGVSIELATLKDRIAAPTAADPRRIVPWKSPGGKDMRIAAAAPTIPWSDLVYSLLPNGRTLDYTVADTDDDFSPPGVLKQSFVAGLYASGQASGFYQPTPANATGDFSADLTSWFARVNAGGPYDDPFAQDIIRQIRDFRSPYYLPPAGGGPAPLYIASGWTDDLFPPAEALRLYNRNRASFPANPIALRFFDFGHQRGSNRAPDLALLRQDIAGWFERHVKGNAAASVPAGVTAQPQTCPRDKTKPSDAPVNEATYDALHPGEVRFPAKPSLPLAPSGDPRESNVADPIANGTVNPERESDPCRSVDGLGPDAPDTATYRLPPAKRGYLLVGSPTVVADVSAQGTDTQIVARLWDVAPDGASERLVAQNVVRPSASGRQVFQLNANAYRFAAGHVPRLQLLASGSPYVRSSNGAAAVTVSDLELRLPVREPVDCDQVFGTAAPFLPAAPQSRVLAPGVAAGGSSALCPDGSPSSTKPGDAAGGTAGGVALAASGVLAIGAGTSKGGATKDSTRKSARPRIAFGARVLQLRTVRRRGLSLRVTCASRCTATADMKLGSRRLGRAKRTAKARFTVRVKASKAGLRRLGTKRTRRVRVVVRVRDASGRTVARTGRFALRRR